MSILLAVVIAGFLAGPPKEANAVVQNDTTADWVTLRDDSVVRGEITRSTSGTTIYVRRAWARENVPKWAERWEAAEAPAARSAQVKRMTRLSAWRRERAAAAEGVKDPILEWIDAEMVRLKDENAWKSAPLMLVKLSRGDVETVTRTARDRSRLLRLAWTSELPDPENLDVKVLKQSLEGRGFNISQKFMVSIDGLLSPQSESDHQWSLRRAATEISVDSGLRFVRYQGLLLPESASGEQNAGLDLSTALGTLKQLLGENPVDPLPAKLREVAARGRTGVLVTRLEMAPDFSNVTVVIDLWLRRGADLWTPAGSRSSQVRVDALAVDAGKDLVDDPQVSTVFQVVDAIGLGAVAPELKQRSLKMGAATREALREAKAAAEADLAALVLPVLAAPINHR